MSKKQTPYEALNSLFKYIRGEPLKQSEEKSHFLETLTDIISYKELSDYHQLEPHQTSAFLKATEIIIEAYNSTPPSKKKDNTEDMRLFIKERLQGNLNR